MEELLAESAADVIYLPGLVTFWFPRVVIDSTTSPTIRKMPKVPMMNGQMPVGMNMNQPVSFSAEKRCVDLTLEFSASMVGFRAYFTYSSEMDGRGVGRGPCFR